MRGFATAGGWTHLKYIIKATETPTDKPNVINETPINLLKIIPVTNWQLSVMHKDYFYDDKLLLSTGFNYKYQSIDALKEMADYYKINFLEND